MEVNPPGLQPPLPIRSNRSLRELPKRRATTRDRRPQNALGKDATKRPPSYARTGDKIWPPLRSSPATRSRPLFSSRRHKSGEQLRVKTKASFDGARWKSIAEGSGVGREGRHFTVANVGNNGQIFLRPIVRRYPERQPQPPVTFPLTPPRTAGLQGISPKDAQPGVISGINGITWNSTLIIDTPSSSGAQKSADFDFRPLPTRRRRAVSDSTARNVTLGTESTGANVLKVVISKPQTETRAKTAEDLDSKNSPFLQVSIPTWKMGTPRFTLRGTPLIRGSSDAPTEDMRSNHASLFGPSLKQKTHNLSHSETFSSRMASFLSSHPQSHYATPSWLVQPGDSPPSPILNSTSLASRPANLVIEPSMFDALTFKPECDDQTLVRYSPTTKAITAATPARLVAEITSPSFLDYDLISDFFLTFRSFLSPTDLLRLLIARLRWALSQGEQSGMIVKVRTFVAIRHWILNYFVDDFVVDYHLRVTFCDLLNDFSVDLPTSQPTHTVPFKIVGELKKCWRQLCAQYWDAPELDAEQGYHVPITPGGIAGLRNRSLTPSLSDFPKGPQSDGAHMPTSASHPETAPLNDLSRSDHVDLSSRGEVRPTTPIVGTIRSNRPPPSPMSVASLDVVSCSFPTKALRLGELNASMSFGAHPADPSSIYTNTDPIASTPRAVTSRRGRPQTSHRRKTSQTDTLRRHGTNADKTFRENSELPPALPLSWTGNLVRGNLLPPGQPFVNLDSIANKAASRQTTIFQPQPNREKKGKKHAASAMSGQGMRKLVGSVRRALSTRGLGVSHAHGNLGEIAPIGPRGATINRLPVTAVVPPAGHLSPGDSRHPCRIDTLGARIAEDFNQAVREDAADIKFASTVSRSLTENAARNVEYSAAHLDSSFELRPPSDTAITVGSQSIVIVDGTTTPEQFVMTGALPPFNRSVEPLANSMSRQQSRNPTPPMTPPSMIAHETPRPPSFTPSQHIYGTFSTEGQYILPSSAIDGVSGQAAPACGDAGQEPKLHSSFASHSLYKPPSTYLSRHQRQSSCHSYQSRGSLYQGRFDLTACSEGSRKSEIMPPPLRMLRRKPGRDLRGAAHLEPLPLRTSRSIDSLTVYSDSLRSSYIRSVILDSGEFVDLVNSEYAPNRDDVFSLGTVDEYYPKPPLSLFSTHSSKPVMRPSFEIEAQKLAQIPDDDDGGVESTLLKLEGKYERKTDPKPVDQGNITKIDTASLSPEFLNSAAFGQGEEEKASRTHLRVGEEEVPEVSPISGRYTADIPQGQIPCLSKISSFSSEESLENPDSMVLLDKKVRDAGRSGPHASAWTNHSILEGPDSPVGESEALVTTSLNPSFEFVNRTQSLERAVKNMKANEDHSFLNVDSDNDSELSSELSAEMIDESDYMPRPLSSDEVEGQHAKSRINERCGMKLQPHDDEPTDALTFAQALKITPPKMTHPPDAHMRQLWSQKPLPPTPVTTPTTATPPQVLGSPLSSFMSQQAPGNAINCPGRPEEQSPAHLPFILAFDSEVLAQQFTLIEKDALIEVDWKELIEMRWKNSHNDSRSWVDFLRNTDARGVEVVIARFNIMVKWAISEIVLTREVEERARCIIKLLHIAAHCRKYRNFATMSQITIALTSNEVGRLSKTWAMVPPTDMKTMRDLETLVSPTKNFYNLRAEMEGGGNAADTGCIPFVGIYTHDLLFNSQRPSEIASSPTTPPLVNFERCRVTATIVKTLLRLLEASTYYQFQPIEGITERCLWMGALTDDEIRRKSESLE